MRNSCVVLFVLMLSFFSCQKKSPQALTIATAANLQYAMADMAQAFTKTTNIPCKTVISSSGKLTAQIKAGAPFDVFVSADMKYPQRLFEEGFLASTPQIYAYGKLVLWTSVPDLTPSLDLLTSEEFEHIAIANPKTAPYGRAAMEVLQNKALMAQVEDKLVYGESISQANQFIVSQAAKIGFTSLSVVLSEVAKDKGQWVLVDTTAYQPIVQGIALMKNSPKRFADAQRFQDFILSPQGVLILDKFGYTVAIK